MPDPLVIIDVNAAGYAQALSLYNSGDIAGALTLSKTSRDPRAQSLAGHIYKSGDLGAPNYRDAVIWYRKAANQGNDDAMVALGDMAVSGQGGLRADEAIEWLSSAAKLGRTDAMRVMADLYIKGVGATQDQAEGINWLTLAADQGDVLAARRAGDIYIDSDPQKALRYYEKAASLGDPESAYFASIMYAENLAIRPNDVQSAKLMKQAALASHPAAMADYGLLVYQGRADDGSPEAAAKWFERAAQAGDDQGKFLYAFTLAKGEGIVQDFEQAYYWLLKTKNSGIPEYDKDIETLKAKLEANVDAAVLASARAKALK